MNRVGLIAASVRIHYQLPTDNPTQAQTVRDVLLIIDV